MLNKHWQPATSNPYLEDFSSKEEDKSSLLPNYRELYKPREEEEPRLGEYRIEGPKTDFLESNEFARAPEINSYYKAPIWEPRVESMFEERQEEPI